jgi:hypothetical protein
MKLDALLLQALALPVAVIIAYQLFRWLGKRWIEQRFKERLEDYKHRQQKELEHFRHEVNALFQRVTKIHDKEFELLPKGWELLQDGLGRVGTVCEMLKEYPDFRLMSDDALQEFLNRSKLNKHQKRELEQLDRSKRYEYYSDAVFWIQVDEAHKALTEFHNFLFYNKIFLSSDLFKKFREIDSLLSAALLESRSGKQAKDNKLIIKAYKDIRDKAEPLCDEVEKLVQKRLHYEEFE